MKITDFWKQPATINPNRFKYKSLSCWSYNIAVGCEHACTFCYVPEVSTIRMGSKLADRGVKDPDAEWGDYVFVRPWHEKKFLHSLRMAEETKPQHLNADGNRAVMLCTTTDPYQVLRSNHPMLDRPENMERTSTLQGARQELVRNALRHILRDSTLNVRILTRSPLAREDFSLMRDFGNRLLFGMSIPTLRNDLAKVYEPKAPAPSQRLATLEAAKAAGLNVYVAVAPVYPECDAADMEATLRQLIKLDPVTIFMEPINIRADNVNRIAARGAELGVPLKTEVFATRESWLSYSMGQLQLFETIAPGCGVRDDQLHLWPDQAMGSKLALKHFGNNNVETWLHRQWNKISRWPS